MNSYLESVRKQFLYYKKLGEQAMQQLSETELFWQYNEESNSIAMIVKHMAGNMLSRFTDFLTSDGEKEWRNRDAEFVNDLESKEEVFAKWQQGWECVISAVDTVHEDNLETIVYIRNEGHTVIEAFNRQLAHYAYHVGQIVFVAKMCKNTDWQTLSIARNKSVEYNSKKFSQEKTRRHFTDDINMEGTKNANQGLK